MFKTRFGKEMTALQDKLDAYAKYALAAQAAAKAASATNLMRREPEQSDIPAATVDVPESSSALQAAIEVASRGIVALEPVSRSIGLWTAHAGEILPVFAATGVWSAHGGEVLGDSGPVSSSPFELIDELRDEKERVEELITYVHRSLNVPFARKLGKRLADLASTAEEEAPYQLEMSSSSLRMFIRFLRSSPGLTYPGVTLTPTGNIRVQWRAASSKLSAAEFFPDGQVHFVVFTPDRMHPDQTIRLSGIVSVDTFLNAVEPHGVLQWMRL